MARFDSVLGRDRNDATSREVFAMRIELAGGSTDPSSTEEEDDGGAGLIFRVAFGIKDMELEFGVADGLVGDLFVRGEAPECFC